MVAITAQTYAEHIARQPDAFGGAPEIRSGELVDAHFSKANRPQHVTMLALVAEEGEEIVGHLLAVICPTKRDEASYDMQAYIQDISMTEPARGKGLGRKLMTEAERVAGEIGATQMAATVWTGNVASETMFRSLAYKPVSCDFTKRLMPAIPEPMPEIEFPGPGLAERVARHLNPASVLWFLAGALLARYLS